MPVYKLCLKIIKKNLRTMSIYFIIFMVISVMISETTAQSTRTDFSETKTDVAFISEESSPLIDGLKDELSKTVNFVNIPDDPEKLQDALFFRQVTYIIRIPKGFTENFMNGRDVQIEKTTVPDSVYNAYVDMKVNKYFNMAKLYVDSGSGITQQSLVSRLKTDLDSSADVTMDSAVSSGMSNSFTLFYFNFLSYILSSILIFGISIIMTVFNDKDLSRRNFCSPISAVSINLQYILANLVFTVICWAIVVALCAYFDPQNCLKTNTYFMVLNSFVFMLSASMLGYLIGNVVKGRQAISAASNVLSLGPSFIAGVFIQQQYLNDSILKIASFTPTYWYVKANNLLAGMTDFSLSSLSAVFRYMLVEAGFAAAFLVLALVIAQRKRQSNA